METTSIIGLLAAGCTTIAFLPQVIKSVKTRHTRDISLGWLVLLLCGIGLWVVYGLLRDDFVIIAANAATLVFVVVLFVLKTRYG